MSTLPYVDCFFHLSIEMKCERVRGIHVIRRVQFFMNLWWRDKDTLGYSTTNEC